MHLTVSEDEEGERGQAACCEGGTREMNVGGASSALPRTRWRASLIMPHCTGQAAARQ